MAFRAQRIIQEKLARQREETGRVRAIILKARQEGASTWIAARNFRRVHLWSNTQALVVADEDDRSGVLYDIYDRFHENLPPELKLPRKTSLKRKRLGLVNGSELAVETAGDEQAGRSMTVHVLHISELGAWKNADDTLTSLLPSVPPEGSEIVIESTAQGVGNRFHRMWVDAESGNSDWMPIFLPWWIHEEYRRDIDDQQREAIRETLSDWEQEALEAGFEWEGELHQLTLEQIAWRRATIATLYEGDERTFRQEYPSTAREAFLVSGNAFFDEEALEDYERRTRPPEIRGNLLKEGASIILRPASRGYLKVWEMPAKGGHYVIGADTAEGRLAAARDTGVYEPDAERGGRDFNSADVILVEEEVESRDRDGKLVRKREPRMRQVAQLHGRMAPEVFAEQLHMLGYLYSCAGVLGRRTTRVPALEAVERNHASGQTILRILRKELRYPRLFWHRRMNVRVEKPSDVLGWVTNQDTRRPMLDELARSIRQGTIEIPSADTIREMTTFVMGDDGEPEAQEGCHDDRVMDLGITVQMARHHHSDDEPIPAGELEVADTPTGL